MNPDGMQWEGTYEQKLWLGILLEVISFNRRFFSENIETKNKRRLITVASNSNKNKNNWTKNNIADIKEKMGRKTWILQVIN